LGYAVHQSGDEIGEEELRQLLLYLQNEKRVNMTVTLLQTLDPHPIAVVKADHIAQLWPTLFAWDDVFEFTVYPAVTAAEGLEVLKKMPPK
jgi:hypothetical protein